MIIGVPTELKNNEYRVALTPAGARELTAAGHTVLVQAGAGAASGCADAAYATAGARICAAAAEVWGADAVLKVKEPEPEEYGYLREDLVLFTYLHLASQPKLARALLDAGTTAIAYETVRERAALPLLAPMSRVAGKLAPIVGSHYLLDAQGGAGILIGGVAGTRKGKVTVIGAGIAGESAAVMAAGMGANVTILDINIERLAQLEMRHAGMLTTLASTAQTIEEQVADADLVIGTVLVPGSSTPKLVTSAMVERMRPGSVLVDIAIDQGGCFEDSHPTTHDEPTFTVDGKIFYCVANMPGAVPRTSTEALTTATLPYVVRLAGQGWRAATSADPGFASGVNISGGKITHRGVFDSLRAQLDLPESEFDDSCVSQAMAD
ncbi:alanine dehydrogenase [Actinotignum sanguinis]|uniref:Alanine dehydrogenase n=3 Tax=Actinomycetaceae TaxID=2049 RepID=A0ABZ0R971_9ACTO|nr:alanine dehydrogenase [Actinotignum sanguinis]WPJ88192.1 alanine dehydrogenase [Schaalia turicensis]MDE1552671.1 alanine dehydrogenase [Actinotignum sanguinis]MDE1565404.1 alanine dehydrogenase [Actinotignum sanguinis]MDE1576398.1 alanine dehydrogenase [Actinotignum sanguinis]MDE1642191.1 alanine dehydrogenase [Actinotignum sanguinis]